MRTNRWLLVARREYLEHLRTKAFWIGIFMFPLLLCLGILVPKLLEKSKDVRHYAVLDNSGWLLEEVEKRSRRPDYFKLLKEGRKQLEQKGLTGPLEKAARTLAHGQLPGGSLFDDRMLREGARVLNMLDSPGGVELLTRAQLPEALVKKCLEAPDMLRRFWLQMPPDKVKEFAADREKERYRRISLPPDVTVESLSGMVDRDELFAFFVINKDPVGQAKGCLYISNNMTDLGLKKWFQRHATALVRHQRMAQAKIDPKQAAWVSEPLVFEKSKADQQGKVVRVNTQDRLLQYAPAAFVYLLWISVMIMTQVLLTSTIEEKSNRVIEVLLSSVSPLQLMSGKIVGSVATGLTMVFSWAFFFALITTLLPMAVDMGNLNLWAIFSNPRYCISFLVYFLLGYLFYAAILVGLGSACNSLKEAQNLMQPVMIIFMVPLFAMIFVVQDPNGSLARVLSFIPPFTPFLMMNRAAGPPELWEYIATTALMLVSLVLAFWAAAKIFRVGILMTGKPVKLREMLGWLRAPVGTVRDR